MQVYKLLTIIALGLFFLILQISFSKMSTDQNSNYASRQIIFNANQLNNIHQTLINKSLKISSIKKLQDQIVAIKNYAIQCTVFKKNQLIQLKQLSRGLEKNASISSNLTYEFNQDKQNLIKDNNNCQLMIFQADKIYSFANNIILQTNDNLNYKNILDLIKEPKSFSFSDIQIKAKEQIIGTWSSDLLGIIFEITIFSLVIGALISKLIHHYAQKSHRPIRSEVYIRFSYILTPLLTIFSVWLYMFSYTEDIKTPPPIVNMIYFSFIFILLKFISDIYLKIVYKRQINHPAWVKNTYFYINLIFVTTFIHYAYSFLIFNMMVVNNTSIILSKLANIFNLMIWIEWLYLFKQFRDKEFIYHNKFEQISIFVSLIVSMLYALRITSSLFGTNYEYDEVIANITLKIFTIGIFVYVCFMFDFILQELEQWLISKNNLNKWLTYQKRKLWEFNLIKICLLGIFIIFSLKYILMIFDFPDHFIADYEEFFFNGFKLGYINIAPCIVLYSFLTFGLFSVIGKCAAYLIVSQSSLENEPDKKNTLEKIFRYSLYVLSFLVTMSIWGIKIQEIYYLIGALGLGIGIGLQSLVMDVISGLLILIIKPIQIGDYITILTKERISGYIHEIDFLSTQIISHHSNMTRVPNGVLIREYILNFSKFQTNTYCFISVTLKKINDFENAKKIILDIILEKPEVLNTEYQKPTVAFECLEDSVGHDSYILTLSFNVEHPEDKKFILSKIQKEIIDKLTASGIKLVITNEDEGKPFIHLDL